MRTLILVMAIAASALAAATAFANDDPLAELHTANYLTVHNMEAQVPHGSLLVSEGTVASFQGINQRTAGIMLGDIELTMSSLPDGEGVLNLFKELQPDKRIVRKQGDRAFYSVAMGAGSEVQPGMYITALRTWDDLSRTEQEAFESVYLQAYSDAWIEEAAPSGGHPGGSHWGGGGQSDKTGPQVKVRYPVGSETFAAIWTDNGDRWDYRIDASGETVTVTDYYRNITYVQQPWAPEEGDLDPAVRFSAIDYDYAFFPSGGEFAADGPGLLNASITARFTVTEPRERIELISYPWMDISLVQDQLASEMTFKRGGPGYSDWSLFVDGDFTPGEDYELRISSESEVPETYWGIGYAGVYRFDTAALWPGEEHPVDIKIKLAIEDNGWTVVPSGKPQFDFWAMGGPDGGYGPLRDEAEALWPGCTRNQMLVATKFPTANIATAWGELAVYAPPELSGDVTGMESITSLGEIIGYFSKLWGDRGVATQPVFLIPGEHGVQAFEDAGLIFILGGDRTGIPLIAHETSHLWWGYDVSGPRWFFEGMANYGAAKFLEYYYGAGGPEEGNGDPLFYRRYIMNFSLGYELPMSMDARDDLDDTAAIYHNSAAFLLTMDELRPYGIDGILSLIHEAGWNAPAISSTEMRDIFADQSDGELGEVWDAYAVRGEIPHTDVDDPTFRRFEFTPARENYVKMLRWLTPAYKKQAIGDFGGALHCAKQALQYRAEPKDFLLIAELTYKNGQFDEAWERCAALLENPTTDEKNAVKVHWLLSRIYRAQGDEAAELLELDAVIADGPAQDLLYLVQQANERRIELTGEETEVDAESGATPSGGGHPGG